MKKIILLLAIAAPVYADPSFVCTDKAGHTAFQDEPCTVEHHKAKQEVIDLPVQDPERIEAEAARFRDWQDDFNHREAAEAQAEREDRVVQAREREVRAAEQEAVAAHRMVDVEQQNANIRAKELEMETKYRRSVDPWNGPYYKKPLK